MACRPSTQRGVDPGLCILLIHYDAPRYVLALVSARHRDDPLSSPRVTL